MPSHRCFRPLRLALLALALAAVPAAARRGEETTARYLDAVRGDPVLALIFVREMPKGADLHSHLSGAVYAESYLRWAAEDGLCVDTASLSIETDPCTPSGTRVRAAAVADTSALYARLLGAMSMRGWVIGFLRPQYPAARVTLHAGELWPGLVPAEGLRSHIREAVEVAGASRIGHGVAVLHEGRPQELLAELARRRVLVEVALTSNDVILGVRGTDHPLRAYLAAGVPVALATDEGVSRSEMSLEFLRAVQDQGLGYPALKGMARVAPARLRGGGTALARPADAGAGGGVRPHSGGDGRRPLPSLGRAQPPCPAAMGAGALAGRLRGARRPGRRGAGPRRHALTRADEIGRGATRYDDGGPGTHADAGPSSSEATPGTTVKCSR